MLHDTHCRNTATERVTSVTQKEPKDWITVNGKHIPIFEGESKDDAYNRYVAKTNEDTKEKQIAKHKEEADRLNGKIPKITQDGETAEDGSITMQFLHIANEKTADFGKQFGQHLEPAGEYMSYIPEGTSHIDQPNYHYGTIHFNKPLILEHKSTGENGWKKDLSEKFGGKTGKALSAAIKKAGYDAVVTWEDYKGQKYWSEIVNLNGQKSN